MINIGLDNGICVRRTEYSNKIKELKYFERAWDDKHQYDFEICYWRKCWNVRGAILDALNATSDNDYECPITLDNINAVIYELQYFNKHTWDESESIWTWEEQKSRMRRYIRDLKYLKQLMKKYPEIEVYFYDSY